jgi:hypothetical protein
MGLVDVPSQQSNGLFSALVRDPVVLYQAYLDAPDLIGEDVGLLLTQLITQQKKLEDLTEEELRKLDAATVSFAQHSPRSKSSLDDSKKVPLTPRGSTDHEEEPEIEWHDGAMRLTPPGAPMQPLMEPDPPVDIPTVPTKWWDKSNH